ncbi:MAG: hypothetical protein ACOYOU_08345, partial [Kiritimatiellia bacterium]
MTDKIPLTIKRPEPALWIERVVLYSTDNPRWTILQDYTFRRGVNVIWGESTAAAADAAKGHSVGKTTLVRLIRYAMGEETYATEEDEKQIQYEFRRGYIGMTVHVGTNVWSLVRSIGVNGVQWARVGVSLEELIAAKNTDDSYQDFLTALNESNTKKWPFPAPPGSDRIYEWPHLLGWMARDQEARHRCFYVWRDKTSEAKMKAFRFEKKDPLHFVRMILGCIDDKEYKAEAALNNLDEVISTRQKKEQAAKDEKDAQRVYLENQIAAHIPQEERQDLVDFFALKDIGTRYLDGKAAIAAEAHAMAEEALRTCRARKRQLDDQVREVTDALNLDVKNRVLPDSLNVAFCPLTKDPLSKCHLFQEYVNRIRQEILSYEISGQSMDVEQRREFIEKKMECDTELAELRKQELKLTTNVSNLSKKAIAAGAALQNFGDLWNSWETLSLQSAAIHEPHDENSLPSLRKDRERLKAALDKRQFDSEVKHMELGDLYRALCQNILGRDYSGAVEYPPKADLAFNIHAFNRKANGAAITTLGSHLADVTALLWAANGEGCHPGLLIHDSPREADMTDHLYAVYLQGMHRLAERTGGE